MIELREVSKIYPDGTVAVENVSLLVPEGKTTVLVGSSGCGKTTLLRMVNRMVTPTSGQVLVGGVDVATAAPVQLRRSIGYVMQNAGLLPHRRVIDNIATVPLLNRVPKKAAHQQALELMDTVGLDRDLARRYPAQLSGGQQQRVGVARGLAADPKVLLMDEPFGAIDPIVRTGLQRELRDLQARLHKTILFVTHDITEAFTLGDQIVILAAGGRVAQAGSPTEILTDPADDFVRDLIGLSSGDRTLHLEPGPYGDDLVIDSLGRPVGRLRGRP
ncbi:MAG: ATP-binding cassette domain-containing protein [Actinomycetia bacterium]|nr:ATP-binding cassette domain-containing protein [Actinomycetes bacterium]